MGRFYFHIRGPDGLEPDQLGLEFESADQAYFEACRAIPKLATDLLEHGRDPLTSAFEISDAHGRVVMEVPFGEGLNRSWRLRRSGGRTRSGPRSRTAAALLAEQVYRAGFEGSPSAYVVLTPDLRILGANASFLKLTHTSRERVMGRNAFEAFPDNPNDPKANGARNLAASFDRALRFGVKDALPRQRYDIRGRGGDWLMRYWAPTTWATLDDDGSPIALIQHVVPLV